MSHEPHPTKEYVIDLLAQRGVTLPEMSELVVDLQKPYIPDLTGEAAFDSIHRVLEKREVQNAIITGIALDQAAERGELAEPLLSILRRDDGLYGIDEIMALSIVNIYGTIGLTNFGYLDKTKPGVIGKLNAAKRPHVNTYIDDLVAAVVAAACSRLAHQARDRELHAAEGEVAATREQS